MANLSHITRFDCGVIDRDPLATTARCRGWKPTGSGSVHRAFVPRPVALCTYPIERCSHDHMVQIFSNHGSTLLNRNSEWQRLELRRRTD